MARYFVYSRQGIDQSVKDARFILNVEVIYIPPACKANVVALVSELFYTIGILGSSDQSGL